MIKYHYSAVNAKTNERTKGLVEAVSTKAAAEILKSRGFTVVKISESGEDGLFASLLGNKVKTDDIVMFTSQLATMLSAGVSLSESVSLIRIQASTAFKAVLDDLLKEIQGGATLAKAMERQKEIFGTVIVASVRVGEATGKLDEVLLKLSEVEERNREFKSKTKGALVYPIIVVVVMVLVMLVMLTLVVPKLTSMFADLGGKLPLPTRILMMMGDFMKNWWWLVFLGIGGLVTWFLKYAQTTIGRRSLDGLVLKLPVWGNLQKVVIQSESSRTLALLISSGIPILEGMEIIVASTSNVWYKDVFTKVSQGVEKGITMAPLFAESGLFSPLFSQMIAVGEQTGKVSEMLEKLSAYYESEATHLVKNLTTAIEPLIMVVLGVAVMFLVIAIVMPIYQMTSYF